MKKLYVFVIVVVVMFSAGFLSTGFGHSKMFFPKYLNPVVSCQWLEDHKSCKNLVIVDVRTADEYSAGHIESSVNIPFEVPFSAWITMVDCLLLELPDLAKLSAVLAENGINNYSKVVLVASNGEPPFPQASATRAAMTLRYGGIHNVSILSGGYPQWAAEGRVVTTDVPEVTSTECILSANDAIFVDIDYVYNSIGKKIIIDARDVAVYKGKVIEDWAKKAGHIPSAISLPASLFWNNDGTYKSRGKLGKLVWDAIGPHYFNDEIIVYCGVGGYASSMWFVLTQVLRYPNVKVYDGSAQEWVLYYDMEL